jgi:HemY protein
MRWLFSLLLLLGLAVAAALTAGVNKGYVLVIYPPYRIELSLALVIIGLVAGFLALHALLRLTAATLRLPRQVRDYRRLRTRNRARNAMEHALISFLEGRFRRAEKFATAALKLDESPALSAVMAARAAHEQHNREARDGYLKAVEIAAPEGNLLKLITQAEFLLEDRRPREALEALNQARAISPRHPALPRLEIKAHALAKNWDKVLTSIAQLSKSKEFDREQLEPLRLNALRENLLLKGQDSATLRDYWRKISSTDQQEPGLAAAAAGAFVALSMGEDAKTAIERALKNDWDSALVALYGEAQTADTHAQIERAEEWLQDHPGDAALLLTLGKLCARDKLWGKAQSYMEASLSVGPSRVAHAAYAQLMEKMGKPEEALRYNRRRALEPR